MFYHLEVKWVDGQKPDWEDISLLIFLNHTSLFEPLIVGALPLSFLWKNGRSFIVPGADKTLNRPIVGTFYKLFSPQMISITRKRDASWDKFLRAARKNPLVAIAAEGRMMRPNGLDSEGNPMSIRGGVADIIKDMDKGKILIVYSGGLHHIQKPGEWKFKIFQTIRVNFEVIDLPSYKAQFSRDHFKKEMIEDLEERKKRNCP